MTLKKWTAVLLSLAAFIHCQVGNSQTEFLKNEHLVVVSSDLDGVAKLWITSKLFASTITIPLGLNVSISSAYSEQSSKSRELTVESSYISNTTSRHHIFIPLENAVLVATFAYNGSEVPMINTQASSVQTSPVQVRSLSTVCRSMSRCASLGVYKIGGALYTLCASSSGVCICGLRTSDDSDGQKLFTVATNCRLLRYPRNDIDVYEISNIVTYQSHGPFGHLLFALNNHLYQTIPVYGSDRFIYIPSDCLVVTRLRIVASKLLIYCTNNSIVEYDMDSEDFSLPQFNNHLYFPCSETMDFSVNLTNAEISYRINNIPSQSSGVRIGRFKFGECITHQNHHLFLYINSQNNSLHIVNSTNNMLLPYNLTEGTPRAMCTNNEYDRPVIIHERYIIAYDLGCQITSVFDLQNFTSPIITQTDRPLQLAAIIFNLSTVVSVLPTVTTASTSTHPMYTTSIASHINFTTTAPSISVTKRITVTSKRDILFTVTTEMTENTAMTTAILNEEDLVIAPPVVIGTFIIAIVILIFIIIGIVVMVTSNRKFWRKTERSRQIPVSEHGTCSSRSTTSREGNSIHASTNQLLDQSIASRDPSGSNIMIPPTDTSQVGGHNLTAVHNPSYGQELKVSTVPVEESCSSERINNCTQQVVGSTL